MATGGTQYLSTDPLVDGNHYYVSQTTGVCGESTTRLDVLVTIVTTPGVPGGSASQSFCANNNPTVADLSATGSNIKWYSLISGGSALSGTTALVNGNHYYASQTVTPCEGSDRLDVTVTIFSTPSLIVTAD